MKLFSFSFIMLLFSSSFLNLKLDSSEWKEVTKTDNWTVYTRTTDQSNVKAVKVIGFMEADFESVKSAMSDIDAYPEWVYSCIDSYKFDELSDVQFHSYTLTDLPFPLKNRDLVVSTTLEHNDDENVWQTISDAKPSHLNEKDIAVRIKNYHAEWKMTRREGQSIDFTYQLAMEPGGIVPAWLVNFAIAKIPVNTIKALEKRSKDIMLQKQ